ncbi:50S ribosomal protein L15 [bacterium]|nr:50S ribosomal protein L15 [bacterium]
MLLNNLRPPKGAVKNRTRLGRGESSGLGKTSGKGHKGQKARAGGYHKTGFEGGQMPLQRRMPKRGFHNFTREDYTVINVGQLAKLSANAEVDGAFLKANGIVKNLRSGGVRVLGNGDLGVALTIKATHFSASAKEKIEKAGGKAVVID